MIVSKRFCDGERIFFSNEGGVKGVLFKNILLVDLSGSQHLLEVLHTSPSFENSENVVKSGSFEMHLRWRASCFFRIKEGYKVSYVKTSIFR